MKKPTTKKPCKREEQFKQQRMRICADYMPIGVPLGRRDDKFTRT